MERKDHIIFSSGSKMRVMYRKRNVPEDESFPPCMKTYSSSFTAEHALEVTYRNSDWELVCTGKVITEGET